MAENEDSKIAQLSSEFNKVKLIDEEISTKFNISKSLQTLECPFNWRLENLISGTQFTWEDLIISIQDKIESIINDTCDFYKFILSLFAERILLCYFQSQYNNDNDKAMDNLNLCHSHLSQLEQDNCQEPLFSKIRVALWHVVLACKAHIVAKSENLDEVKQILQLIHPVSDMTKAQKAGFEGMKAQMLLEFSSAGYLKSEKCARTASTLDPKEAEWYFMIAKAISRRTNDKGMYYMSLKEQRFALEQAVKLRNCPSFLSFLAKTLLKWNKMENDRERKTNNQERAVHLYKKCLEIHRGCPHEMYRVAKAVGFMPPPHKDVKFAIELMEECLRIAPNIPNIQVLAGDLYALSNVQRYDEALEHYKLSYNLQGLQHLVRLKYQLSSSYDAYDDLVEGFNFILKTHHRTILHVELGSYFLFRKNDLKSSIEHYRIVIENEEIVLLKNSTNCAALPHPIPGGCNVLNVLINEVHSKLETDGISQADRTYYKNFITEMEASGCMNLPNRNPTFCSVKVIWDYMNKKC